MQTKGGTFDADTPTGNNLGRYANQRGIVEVLRNIKEMSQAGKPQMTEDDWVKIEKELEGLANANFKVVAGQLVLVAKEDTPSSSIPTEIFTNYQRLQAIGLALRGNTQAVLAVKSQP